MAQSAVILLSHLPTSLPWDSLHHIPEDRIYTRKVAVFSNTHGHAKLCNYTQSRLISLDNTIS
jgi:hypothetical protein